jgi:hypothetical protein
VPQRRRHARVRPVVSRALQREARTSDQTGRDRSYTCICMMSV